jgi:hypothetical protein
MIRVTVLDTLSAYGSFHEVSTAEKGFLETAVRPPRARRYAMLHESRRRCPAMVNAEAIESDSLLGLLVAFDVGDGGEARHRAPKPDPIH